MTMSVFVVTIVSTVAYIGYSILLLVEEKRDDRLVLKGARQKFDEYIVRLSSHINNFLHYVSKRIITLSWYYSLHALLKLALKFLASLYFSVEQMLINNRNKARQIRRSQRSSHLTVISEHQKETALTETEKKRRKDKALKG